MNLNLNLNPEFYSLIECHILMSKGGCKEWITIQSRLSMASKIRHPFKESWSVVFVATDCLLRISNNLKLSKCISIKLLLLIVLYDLLRYTHM